MPLTHNCGVAAVFLKKPLSEYPRGGATFYLSIILDHMQSRGRLSSGVAVAYGKENPGIRRRVVHGTVQQLFSVHHEEEHLHILDSLSSSSGIGHVRYATSGNGLDHQAVLDEAQPLHRLHGRSWKEFALAYNGNLTNDSFLRRELCEQYGYTIRTKVDTELIMHYFALDLKSLSDSYKGKPPLPEVVTKSASRFDGAFNVVFLNGQGEVLAFRDGLGFRPLIFGEDSEIIALASESSALEKIGISSFRDIPVGGGVYIHKAETQFFQHTLPTPRHCMFEWVYFSSAPSFFEAISVDLVRERLGKELASLEPLIDSLTDEYIVVPVPDTSLLIAQSLARELGLEYVHAISKTSGFGRGFINKPQERKRIMDGKYNVIRRRIEGKKIIAVDDSVVRGETFSMLAETLRLKGAKEVHLRSACPPIYSPCFYGIDFPTREELITYGSDSFEEAESMVAQKLHLDSMKYMTLDGLIRAIGLPKNHLCLACLNRDYPTQGGKEKFTQLMTSSI